MDTQWFQNVDASALLIAWAALMLTLSVIFRLLTRS